MAADNSAINLINAYRCWDRINVWKILSKITCDDIRKGKKKKRRKTYQIDFVDLWLLKELNPKREIKFRKGCGIVDVHS